MKARGLFERIVDRERALRAHVRLVSAGRCPHCGARIRIPLRFYDPLTIPSDLLN